MRNAMDEIRDNMRNELIDEVRNEVETNTLMTVILNMLKARLPYEAISSATTWPVEKIAAVAKEKGLTY